jgi:thiol-disulfide isomerase/thioredoxin
VSGSPTVRLFGALTVLVLVLSGCSSEAPAKKEPSDQLPNATFTSLDGGKSLDLSTLRGPMVINLWASWCQPCRKELPKYQAFSEKYAGKVDVLGIDFQETRVGAARRLARDTGVDYPLYVDPDGKMRARFMPKLILLDKDGKIAHEMYIEITSVTQLEGLVRKHLGVNG